MDNENLARAYGLHYDKDENVWKVKVEGIKAGDTRMSITAKYRITLGTEKLVVSERTVVLINVTEAPAPPEPPAPPESGTGPAKPPESGNTAGTEPDGT